MKKKKLFFIVCLLGVLYIILIKLLHIDCPIRALTHIPCPGCGLTRSQIAMFQLDFTTAFYYHPLFFIPIPSLVWLFFRCDKKWSKFECFLLVVIMILFVAVYVIRLLMHHPFMAI